MSGHEGFHYEIEKSTDPVTGAATTTIHCHGRLVATTANELKDLVKPMIPEGGHIVLDFADLAYMDSSGLGTLVGLKATAVKEGYCRLILENLTPRVKELLSLTNLLGLFSS